MFRPRGCRFALCALCTHGTLTVHGATMPRRLEPILEMRKIQANMAVPSTGSAAGATLSELVGENLEAPPAVAIKRVGFVVVCA